jgi:3-phytase
MPHNFAMKRNAPLLGAVCAVLLSACATAPVDDISGLSAPTPQTATDAVVAEAWISAPVAEDELDSVAVWPTEEGGSG